MRKLIAKNVKALMWKHRLKTLEDLSRFTQIPVSSSHVILNPGSGMDRNYGIRYLERLSVAFSVPAWVIVHPNGESIIEGKAGLIANLIELAGDLTEFEIRSLVELARGRNQG